MNAGTVMGFVGDTLTCVGGILLAWDAIHGEREFRRIRKIAQAIEEKSLARIHVVLEGVQISAESDVERAFIRRSARKALIGSILLAIGFVFLFVARVLEAAAVVH
jgi:hypothetical protein